MSLSLWVPIGNSHKKAHIEEWLYIPDEMMQCVEDNGIPDRVPPLPGPATAPPTWRWEEAPLPPPRAKTLTNVVHPLPSVVELRRLAPPFSAEDILSCYEPDVIVRNDSFTPWSKIGYDDLLALHMVDTKHALAAFRSGHEPFQECSNELSSS